MHFSLRVNRKQIATNSSPYRDQQFQQICSLRTRFQRQGLPIISVNSKKREMIGNFKDGGAKWDRSPVLVNDHDFLSMPAGWESPMAFMTRLATGARSASASLTIRPPSPLIPSLPGGNARDRVATAAAQTPGAGRLRWQQQLHFLALEDRTPEAAMQSLRHCRHHRPLSDRRLQVESHRAL